MKQQVTSLIQNFISSTEKSYPSIYSRIDVIVLLNDILFKVNEMEDVEVDVKVESEEGTYTKQQIIDAISDMRTDNIVDIRYESAEFELYGNEVSVTEIDYDVDVEEIQRCLFKELDNK